MNQPQALHIATPTHPMAIAQYVMVVVFGFTYSSNLIDSETLDGFWGPLGTSVWALMLMLPALTALVAAGITPHVRVPVWPVQVERWACLTIAILLTVYVVVIWPIGAWATMLFVSSPLIGAAGRFLQARGDIRKMRTAQHRPETATVLGDPET